MARAAIYFQWQPSSYSGWGVYGLNLLLHSAGRSEAQALSTCGVDMAYLAVTPLERLAMRDSISASNRIADELCRLGSGTLHIQGMVLHALGNDLARGVRSAGDVDILSEDMVGVVFAEVTEFTPQAHVIGEGYARLIAGSDWQKRMLQASGFERVETVLQGVDLSSFHPAPKLGLFADRFVVFSGGKLEHRKGQDLVVKAFAAFAQNHPDAMLMTAWSSPFRFLAAGLNSSPGLEPLEFVDGEVDTLAWTTANGIHPSQVTHLGLEPNAAMPRILREADVGLFPNRAEAGTNLVAMEAMACGIPCILSMNTGHLDIIGDGSHCLALGTQHPIREFGCEGWGESDVDEIVAVLEAAYIQRQAAQIIGQRGAAFISELAWPRQIAKLIETVSDRDGKALLAETSSEVSGIAA